MYLRMEIDDDYLASVERSSRELRHDHLSGEAAPRITEEKSIDLPVCGDHVRFAVDRLGRARGGRRKGWWSRVTVRGSRWAGRLA